MNPSLDVVIPPHGMVVIDSPLEGKRPVWSPAHVDHNRREAARTAAGNPYFPAGMATATIVARGAESNYVRRAASRIVEAASQLPLADDSLVCLYWTNGASIPDVVDVLDWSQLPAHVSGLMFVGLIVAFPHQNIDVFRIQLVRGWRRGDPGVVDSALDNRLAELILRRAEASAGVRATLIRGDVSGKKRQLLRRGGSERILPFNLLLDKDLRPREAATTGA